jgi:hypothetical protein
MMDELTIYTAAVIALVIAGRKRCKGPDVKFCLHLNEVKDSARQTP